MLVGNGCARSMQRGSKNVEVVPWLTVHCRSCCSRICCTKLRLLVQVLRRLFLLVGTAALVACKAGSGGVDVALGPNVGCSPLGLLGPAAILHGLVAGPGTEDPRMTTAALPVVSLSLLPTAQIPADASHCHSLCLRQYSATTLLHLAILCFATSVEPALLRVIEPHDTHI